MHPDQPLLIATPRELDFGPLQPVAHVKTSPRCGRRSDATIPPT
jgi:hypothetical protein